ncbi:hypothetical protein PGTUg99_003188 [Puccinia graminis f. sp. tritici]|uniref:Uncharacterized protein n=1 Tax=Puccinia graminis f. sp. tritici TaxID=56615 RepID=A0A5B0S3U8_PUCGR|nr:hypothetical protein PGTUg99_003188 [Puccinia graminis f. sp. tritici]
MKMNTIEERTHASEPKDPEEGIEWLRLWRHAFRVDHTLFAADKDFVQSLPPPAVKTATRFGATTFWMDTYNTNAKLPIHGGGLTCTLAVGQCALRRLCTQEGGLVKRAQPEYRFMLE